MIIKDLEISKELGGKELSAVRGGATNIGLQGGVVAANGGGLNFFSPQTIANAPSMNQTALDLDIVSVTAVGSIVGL